MPDLNRHELTDTDHPDTDHFEYAGCAVAVVDAVGMVAAARMAPVALRAGGAFPPPVRDVRMRLGAVGPDGRPAYRFDARIEPARPAGPRPAPAILGRDPLGILLERRLAAGDQWAARVVDGLDTAVERYRRLGRGHLPTGATDREDPETGLHASVTRAVAGDALEVRAVVADAALVPAHVGAFFRIVLDVVADLVADRPAVAGHEFVLTHGPGTRAAGAAPPRPAPSVDAPSVDDEDERVRLEQVGGLDDIVAQFRQIAVSFQHPEVMARWGARRPQGILLYGPPGTGKTMLARALANEIGADFREVRTPEILDKWLGASERNIKRIFREARRYRRPTVLLFDEFDSVISYAGAGGDAASQAVNAVAGIFKQEMNDLFHDNPTIIVVATTNFPHRVDDSLVRSGRFDVKLAVPPPDDVGRAEILDKMIRRLAARHDRPGFRMFAADVDPVELGRASHGMTGADLGEVLRRVQLAKAMQEARTGAAVPPISQQEMATHIGELRLTATAR